MTNTEPLVETHDETDSAFVDRDFVTSLSRGFSILQCFRRGEKGLGNKEIAARTKLPKSTVARLTYTLCKLGYLEIQPKQEKYALGIGVLTFGQSYLSGLDVRDVARPLMQELAEYTRATVALGANHGTDMVFLELCHGNQMFLMRMGVGERVPHGTTALGRAYAAGLSDAERRALGASLSKTFSKEEWRRIADSGDQARRDYEKYGFCFSLGDWNKEIFAVGVPMATNDSSKVMAFSCSGPAREMTRKRLIGDIGPRLVALRDRVQAAVGGSFASRAHSPIHHP